MEKLGILLTNYESLLRDDLKQTENTIDNKVKCLTYFFKINKILVKDPEIIGIEKYDEKDYKKPTDSSISDSQ